MKIDPGPQPIVCAVSPAALADIEADAQPGPDRAAGKARRARQKAQRKARKRGRR